MRHAYLTFALIATALAAYCCLKWQGVKTEFAVQMKTAEATHLNEVKKLCSDADRQYAQNVRLRAALEAAGYEIPAELQPALPNGEIIASN